jgi:ABC-type nitrate/sulfonate/bicarbonate transport system substrate-binding protein
MSSKPRSRRQFLCQVGVAAGLAAAPFVRRGHAQMKRQVTMRLDWLYQGPNAGFLIAQDKSFYEQAGLNVEIGPGKGSGSTAQLVASKATQFGFADGSRRGPVHQSAAANGDPRRGERQRTGLRGKNGGRRTDKLVRRGTGQNCAGCA